MKTKKNIDSLKQPLKERISKRKEIIDTLTNEILYKINKKQKRKIKYQKKIQEMKDLSKKMIPQRNLNKWRDKVFYKINNN